MAFKDFAPLPLIPEYLSVHSRLCSSAFAEHERKLACAPHHLHIFRPRVGLELDEAQGHEIESQPEVRDRGAFADVHFLRVRS